MPLPESVPIVEPSPEEMATSDLEVLAKPKKPRLPTTAAKFKDILTRTGKVYVSREHRAFFTTPTAKSARRRPVRSSYAKTLRTCPRFFLFQVRYGLRRKGQYDMALEVGKIVHVMYEAIYLGKTSAEALIDASTYVSKYNEELETYMNDAGVLPSGQLIEDVLRKSEQAYSLAQVMFLLSADRFFKAPWIVKEDWKVLAVEQPLQLRWRSIKAPMRCKPDTLLLRPSDNVIMIVNHKTTSFDVQMLAQGYTFDLQASIEHLCVQAAYPDHRVGYYLHNVVRKPTLKYPAKKYPTFDDYLEACRQWYANLEATNPENPPVAQTLRALPPKPMNEELHCALYEVGRASYCVPDSSRFYRDSSACFGKYNNRACPYLPLCSASPALWENIIKDNYVQEFREEEETLESGTQHVDFN